VGLAAPAWPSFAGYRLPAKIISQTLWLYFRFPRSLWMMEETLAFCGIVVSHEMLRTGAVSLAKPFARQIHRWLPPGR